MPPSLPSPEVHRPESPRATGGWALRGGAVLITVGLGLNAPVGSVDQDTSNAPGPSEHVASIAAGDAHRGVGSGIKLATLMLQKPFRRQEPAGQLAVVTSAGEQTQTPVESGEITPRKGGVPGTETTAPLRPLEIPPLPDDKELRTILDRDTVRIEPIGCSGTLIRDPNTGVAIAVETARHCGFRPETLPGRLLHGDDGQTYQVLDQQITASTGDTSDALQRVVGEVDTVILPDDVPDNADDEPVPDTALLVMKGVPAGKAIAVYEGMHLNSWQAGKLEPGTQLVMSGWPTKQQNERGPGVMARQEFPMAVLGTDITETANGDRVEVLWAAVRKNGAGAICSNGASGALGWLRDGDGEWRPGGTLAAFIDMNDAEQSAGWPEKMAELFNVDVRSGGVSGLCGFSYKRLSHGPDTKAVRLVTSRLDVPGYEGPATEADAADYYAKLLADPSVTKFVVNGQMDLSGKGAAVGPADSLFLNRPVVFYNGATNQVAVISYCAETGGILVRMLDHPGHVVVRPIAGSPVGVVKVEGAVAPGRTAGARQLNSYVAPNGIPLGFMTGKSEGGLGSHTLRVDDKGQLQVATLSAAGT